MLVFITMIIKPSLYIKRGVGGKGEYEEGRLYPLARYARLLTNRGGADYTVSMAKAYIMGSVSI